MSAHNIPSPPPEKGQYSRVSPARATADAIPLLVDNTYHVFHLTTPPYTRHHPPRLRSSWWRMQSDDLQQWTRDEAPVIEPSSCANAPDADGIWTGAAVTGLDGNMNILYTGYNLKKDGKQVILRSKANDRHGKVFECPGHEITFVGTGRSKLEDIDFRDPYVYWNEAESQYWMIIASRLKSGPYWSRGCIALLKSTDLEVWNFEEEPLYKPNDMFCPECPELFSLGNGKWYLVYSRFHGPNAGTVYRIADSPYGPFRIPRDGSHGRLDGRRWYAAKSCPKAGDRSRRLYFGWIGDYVDEERKWLWGGDLGVPREVFADESGHLRIEMASEAVNLFQRTSTPVVKGAEISLSSIGSTKLQVLPEVPQTQDLLLQFSVRACDAHAFGIAFQIDETEKYYKLQFSPTEKSLFMASLLVDFPPLDDFWADQYKLHLPRMVDGPEIVRHENVSLDTGVKILLRSQLIEVSFGGHTISWRLPVANAVTSRLGWFVDDGHVHVDNISVLADGVIGSIV